MALDALIPWVKAVPASMPEELRDMAESICGQFLHTARRLIGVFQKFIDAGATIIVIEHDLDMIANADYVVDMGPGGSDAGNGWGTLY